ncbi:MAG: hypothetical protein LBQ11_01695 [Candidatus Nomurabacteria bacterium]|jgi:hypothetical protein|nr:hypothetical protein [Candidatus Nomurabacteria bacterium]
MANTFNLGINNITKHPCEKDCPNRRPNCHDAKYCPEWGEYEKQQKEEYAERKRQAQLRYDIRGMVLEGAEYIRRRYRRR